MNAYATVTGGTIAGYVALPILLFICAFLIWLGIRLLDEPYDHGLGVFLIASGIVCVPLTLACWWWGMAFTLSSDYHAWNVKQGKVEQVAKRLIASGDSGMSERYVVTIKGQPYAIDDTRATLLKPGDTVTLRCKKDWQWGVPRSAHGWACRWSA